MTGNTSTRGDRPVIILGAARSGTKIIRDVIATHPKLVAIPHDINFVWKYGNYHLPHDRLTPNLITPHSSLFIRNFFKKFHEGKSDIRVVEKTISNTIRVEFVRKIFPSCQFIHLIRDGRDVVASSARQWQTPLDTRRVFDKLQYLPFSAIPNYALSYLFSYVKRLVSPTRQVASWGVALEDLNDLLENYSLLEVCAIQWKRSVEHAIAGLESVPESDKLEIRYEHFVNNPTEELDRIMDFLGLEIEGSVHHHIKAMVDPNQVGKWQHQIEAQQLSSIMTHIASTMNGLGYGTPS